MGKSKVKKENKVTGRPKITLDSFPKGWEDGIVDLSEVGASEMELRDYLGGICHETWTRLIAEEPVFSEAIKRCRSKCQIWWERQGRLNLSSKDFSATLWYMNMKNRFKWADKQEIDHTSKGEKITGIDRVIIKSLD